MMPEMDGFEFLDELRERADWLDIPVIVLTAKQLTTDERSRLTGRARQVVAKAGGNGGDLVTVIADAVRRRPARAMGARAC